VQFVDIHGTCYYDIIYMHTDDRKSRSARVGKDDIYDTPRPGDAVRVNYTMNVVTGMERRE
jgi:hypothetical protein